MTLTNDFSDWMNQTVLVRHRTGTGLYGPTYDDGEIYKCRIDHEIKLIRTKSGTEAVSRMQIYLDGSVCINESDKIAVGTESPPILSIEPVTDESGETYMVVVYT